MSDTYLCVFVGRGLNLYSLEPVNRESGVSGQKPHSYYLFIIKLHSPRLDQIFSLGIATLKKGACLFVCFAFKIRTVVLAESSMCVEDPGRG